MNSLILSSRVCLLNQIPQALAISFWVQRGTNLDMQNGLLANTLSVSLRRLTELILMTVTDLVSDPTACILLIYKVCSLIPLQLCLKSLSLWTVDGLVRCDVMTPCVQSDGLQARSSSVVTFVVITNTEACVPVWIALSYCAILVTYTVVIQSSLMDEIPPDLPRILSVRPPTYFAVFPSSFQSFCLHESWWWWFSVAERAEGC